MSNPAPDVNPYASPAELAGQVQEPIVSTYDLIKELKQFRAEIHSLGGMWIVLGVIPLGMAGIYVLAVLGMVGTRVPPDVLVISAFFALIGVPFVACGIGTCYKQLWAVYIGLGLSYLMALLSLAAFNLCAVSLYVSAVFGGHRIISWSGSLRRKGISMTTRPRDIQTPIQLPPMFASGTLDWPISVELVDPPRTDSGGADSGRTSPE